MTRAWLERLSGERLRWVCLRVILLSALDGQEEKRVRKSRGFGLWPSNAATWVAAVLAAVSVLYGIVLGLLPDLIQAVFGDDAWSILLAIVVALIIAIFGSLLVRRRRRTRGVGVVLNLMPQVPDATQPVEMAVRQAGREHDGCERIEMKIPEEGRQRVEKLDELHDELRVRVNRLTEKTGPRPVCIYPFAWIHDAFALGGRLKYDSRPHTVIMQRVDGESESPRPFHEALILGNRLREPLSAEERSEADELLKVRPEELDSAAPEGNLALAVMLTNAPGALQLVRTAARDGDTSKYEMDPKDIARAMLIVEARHKLPPERHSFEIVVRCIVQKWATWLAERGGADEQILFLACPASIAVALGYAFTRTPMRVVRHRARSR